MKSGSSEEIINDARVRARESVQTVADYGAFVDAVDRGQISEKKAEATQALLDLQDISKTEDFFPALEKALASKDGAIIELVTNPEAITPSKKLSDLAKVMN